MFSCAGSRMVRIFVSARRGRQGRPGHPGRPGRWGHEGWGTGPKGGGPKGGGPRVKGQNFALFSPSPASFSLLFSLSGGLHVELWPRVAAMDHPNCAFGLLWVILCAPGTIQRESKKERKWCGRGGKKTEIMGGQAEGGPGEGGPEKEKEKDKRRKKGKEASKGYPPRRLKKMFFFLREM